MDGEGVPFPPGLCFKGEGRFGQKWFFYSHFRRIVAAGASAIQARDPARAQKTIREHLEAVGERLTAALLEKQTSYRPLGLISISISMNYFNILVLLTKSIH